MKRTPLRRIAIVKFTPHGKCYPASCERTDIGKGDQVEIIMRNGTICDGEVVAIQHERWECTSLKVLHLSSEVEYGFCGDHDNFGFTRTIKPTRAALYLVQ